jgi:hypothetical protein
VLAKFLLDFQLQILTSSKYKQALAAFENKANRLPVDTQHLKLPVGANRGWAKIVRVTASKRSMPRISCKVSYGMMK